jgi:hypothetical protein
MTKEESEPQRTLNEIAEEIANIFINEKLSPRQALLVLRELENDATIALLAQILRNE